jgi:hypothetical protein
MDFRENDTTGRQVSLIGKGGPQVGQRIFEGVSWLNGEEAGYCSIEKLLDRKCTLLRCPVSEA